MNRNYVGGAIAAGLALLALVGWTLLRPTPSPVASGSNADEAAAASGSPMPHAPSPGPATRAEDAQPESDAPVRQSASDCGDLDVRAVSGDLEPDEVRCLEALLQPGTTADAREVLTALAVNAWAQDDKPAWEGHALKLASVSEDPNLHLKLAYYYSKQGQPAASLHHADVALGMTALLPEEMHDAWTARLYKMRTRSALQLSSEDASDPEAKQVAAEAAREWFVSERALGEPTEAALAACASVADEAWCSAP